MPRILHFRFNSLRIISHEPHSHSTILQPRRHEEEEESGEEEKDIWIGEKQNSYLLEIKASNLVSLLMLIPFCSIFARVQGNRSKYWWWCWVTNRRSGVVFLHLMHGNLKNKRRRWRNYKFWSCSAIHECKPVSKTQWWFLLMWCNETRCSTTTLLVGCEREGSTHWVFSSVMSVCRCSGVFPVSAYAFGITASPFSKIFIPDLLVVYSWVWAWGPNVFGSLNTT